MVNVKIFQISTIHVEGTKALKKLPYMGASLNGGTPKTPQKDQF